VAPEVPRGHVADTNVLSKRGGVEGNRNLTEWLRRHAGMLQLNIVTIAEMGRGLIPMKIKLLSPGSGLGMMR
jgi:hypothetical protein